MTNGNPHARLGLGLAICLLAALVLGAGGARAATYAIAADCCHATMSCPGSSSICMSRCDPGIAACSCRCGNRTVPAQRPAGLDPGPESRTKLGISIGDGPGLSLGEFSLQAEAITGWDFDVDPAVASVAVRGGTWQGTFEEVLEAFARDHGVDVAIDAALRKVTFTAP